ncbi:MAG: phosphoglucomutase/phosphomannomutase family protein [Crocinitomicaceae bacterium TMED135]|nr:MAG: phosphoglucomutase/phosphomannomutase family protein [Crocinitomicaceae bacterium TMED135]
MSQIRFGTDGWRAIIAKDFTVENVSRVAYATSEWTLKNFKKPSVVIGHDCRFGGKLFVETAVKVFISKGIKVHLAKSFISTPMISMGVKELNASIGVVITASHNPPEYNGYKLKGHFGGPLSSEKVEEVESLIPSEDKIYLNQVNIDVQIKKGNINIVDLEKMYLDRVKSSFDLEAIKNSGLNFAYDAMYGAGQNVMKKLFPEMTFLHCDYNPSFNDQAPEPIDKNLIEFSELIKTKKNIAAGLATDGDADRIGLYNSKGEFVDSHHIILLLLLYLHKYKKLKGKVVVAASTTPRVVKLAEKWGLDHDTVKVGFKYIAGQMVTEDVLIGGEESGGIAIKGHIPERDGIWMGLVLFEYMATSGKSLEELINEVYELVGEFKYCRDDLHLDEKLKNSIVKKCNNNEFSSFGEFKVIKVDKTDGFKFILKDDQWLMIRPSGTEPVLRCYAESKDLDGAKAILAACKTAIGVS